MVAVNEADVIVQGTVGQTWEDIWIDAVEKGDVKPNDWLSVNFRPCGETRPPFRDFDAVRLALKKRNGKLTYSRCTSERLSDETLAGFATRLRASMQREPPLTATTGFFDEDPFTSELRRMCERDGYLAMTESIGEDSILLRQLPEDASRKEERGHAERQKVLMACALESNELAAAAEHEAAAGKFRLELHERILKWAAERDRALPWGTSDSRFGADLTLEERRAMVDDELFTLTSLLDHPLLFEGIADFFDHPDATLSERLTAALALERAALRSPPEAQAVYRKRARSIDTGGLFDRALTTQNLRYEQWEFRFMQKAENEASAAAGDIVFSMNKKIAAYAQQAHSDSLDRLSSELWWRRHGFMPFGLGSVSLILLSMVIYYVLRRRG